MKCAMLKDFAHQILMHIILKQKPAQNVLFSILNAEWWFLFWEIQADEYIYDILRLQNEQWVHYFDIIDVGDFFIQLEAEDFELSFREALLKAELVWEQNLLDVEHLFNIGLWNVVNDHVQSLNLKVLGCSTPRLYLNADSWILLFFTWNHLYTIPNS